MLHLPILALLLAAALPFEPTPPGMHQAPPGINAGIGRGSVITSTGAFSVTSADARLRDIEFTRTYNSNDTLGSTLGVGWTHNLNVHLADPGDASGVVTLVGGQGRADRYLPLGGGAFEQPPGITTLLSKQPDGSFVAERIDKSRLIFDVQGRLTTLVTRYGVETRLEYDHESGRLATLITPYTLTMTFTYDPESGRLLVVDDNALPGEPASATYSYDELGRLSSFTNRSEATTLYTYDGNSDRLASIVNPNGHTVVTNTYDDNARVVSQADAIGAEWTYQYTPLPDGGLLALTLLPAVMADSDSRRHSTPTGGWCGVRSSPSRIRPPGQRRR